MLPDAGDAATGLSDASDASDAAPKEAAPDAGADAQGCGADNTACNTGTAAGLCESDECSTCTDVTDDAHCGAAYAGAYLCVGGACTPGNCRANSDCTANATGPLCGVVTPLMCGKCTNDSQCAGNAGGAVCNTTSGACVAGTCTATAGTIAPAACPVNAADICCGTTCQPAAGANACCSDATGADTYCTTHLAMSATCVSNVCTACPAVSNGQYAVDPTSGSDATGTGSSTAGCAFKTITRALQVIGEAPGLATTITVIGPATVSAGESFPITLPAKVTVTTSTGAVTVNVPAGRIGFMLNAPNSGLEGGTGAALTISGQAETADYGIVATTGSAASTAISSLTVTSFLDDGILVENAGVLAIGAGVVSTLNGTAAARRAGLHVTETGSAVIDVPSGSTPTQFDANTNHGIFVDTDGSITLTGVVTSVTAGTGTVTTNGNFAAGIWVQQRPGTPSANVITGLISFGNTNGNGLRFFGGSNVRVRDSAALGNADNGALVSVNLGVAGGDDISKIDLGTAADAGAGYGGNTFQEALGAAGHNTADGICLDVRANTGTLHAEGNMFGSADCATTATALTVEQGACGNGSDLGIVGAGNDIDVSLCTHP
jgi:hypothetical protein